MPNYAFERSLIDIMPSYGNRDDQLLAADLRALCPAQCER